MWGRRVHACADNRSLINAFSSFSGSENCDGEPDPDIRFWDELSHVGLPQDLDVKSLFESGEISCASVLTSCTR